LFFRYFFSDFRELKHGKSLAIFVRIVIFQVEYFEAFACIYSHYIPFLQQSKNIFFFIKNNAFGAISFDETL